MEPLEYLRGLRRRWAVIVAAVFVALVAGWLTTGVAPPPPSTTSYQATVVMLAPEGVDGLGRDTIAALVTIGEVPERVADALEYDGDPLHLAGSVQARVDDDTNLLRITAVAPEEGEALELADTFADELMAFLRDRSSAAYEGQATGLRETMRQLNRDIRRIEQELRGASPAEAEFLEAQRSARFQQLAEAQASLDQLRSETQGTTDLQIVQDAVAEPLADGGFQAPQSRRSRVLLAGVIGLLAGLGVALLLERYDPRIWTKKAAERHFGFPVLSEVPRLPWWKRRKVRVVAAERPGSASADAYRRLAVGLGPGPDPDGTEEPSAHPHTILVVSGGPREGKTTVVANLATAFSQLGRKALILSCDFSRPRIHELLDVPESPGLSDGIRSANGQILNGRVRTTFVSGVSIVPTGFRTEQPSGLLTSERMLTAIEEAADRADIVLIDTAPLLATSDAMHLVGAVDAVLVVGRAGRTTTEQAERTTELLGRLGAPVSGVVLNASDQAVLSGRQYRQYTDDDRKPLDVGVFPISRVTPEGR